MLEHILALCIPAGGLIGGVCLWRLSRHERGGLPFRGVNRAVAALSDRIRESNFNPDVVVSVENNGWAVGELLVRRLGLTSLTSLPGLLEPGEENVPGHGVALPENLAVERLNVLLVTDAVRSGETLRRALDHISRKGVKAVRTASIFQLDAADFVPDYHIYRIRSLDEISG